MAVRETRRMRKKRGRPTKRYKRYRRTRSKHIRKGRKSRRLRGGVITREQLKKKFEVGDRVYLKVNQPKKTELNVSGNPVMGTGGWQIPVEIKTWDSSSTPPVRNFPGTHLSTEKEWQAQQAKKQRQRWLLESTKDASSRQAVAETAGIGSSTASSAAGGGEAGGTAAGGGEAGGGTAAGGGEAAQGVPPGG